MSLRCCPWWAEQLPPTVTCGQPCQDFPGCLPQPEPVQVLLERTHAQAQAEHERRGPDSPGPAPRLG